MASYKVFALQRIRKYISTDHAKTLASAFINSQFNYCSIIWMFCSKKSKQRIESIHKRTLRIVFREYDKTYEELLNDHDIKSIHQNHLKFILAEVFKSLNNLNPEFMTEFFKEKDLIYSLRSGSIVSIPAAITSKFGINSIHFRAAILWNTLPKEIKESKSISQFKINIKKVSLTCNCIACR